jgi:hypothetical protein
MTGMRILMRLKGYGIDGQTNSSGQFGVMGEAQQHIGVIRCSGVYGWVTATPATRHFSVLWKNSQTGAMSAGVMGQYTPTVGSLVQVFILFSERLRWGCSFPLGLDGGYGASDMPQVPVLWSGIGACPFGVYCMEIMDTFKSANPRLFLTGAATGGIVYWLGNAVFKQWFDMERYNKWNQVWTLSVQIYIRISQL